MNQYRKARRNPKDDQFQVGDRVKSSALSRTRGDTGTIVKRLGRDVYDVRWDRERHVLDVVAGPLLKPASTRKRNPKGKTTRAYLDSFRGLVPIEIRRLSPEEDYCEFKVVGGKVPAYPKGMVDIAHRGSIVARDSVVLRGKLKRQYITQHVHPFHEFEGPRDLHLSMRVRR